MLSAREKEPSQKKPYKIIIRKDKFNSSKIFRKYFQK